MKTLFLSIVVALALCANAFALGDNGFAVPFSNMSATGGTVRTSTAYNVQGFRTKSVHVTGVTLGSTAASPVFKNMSGTLIAECAPSSGGPWSTCAQQDGTAISFTTNGNLSWDGASAYIRLKWTAATGKIKAWLSWLEP